MRLTALVATGIVVAVAAWCLVPSEAEREGDAAAPGSASDAPGRAEVPSRRARTRRARAVPPEPVRDDSAGAADELRRRIVAAVAEDRWNDARDDLGRLERLCTDAAAREAIGLVALSEQVTTGRDAYFRVRMPAHALASMDSLIAAKSVEGALAAARAWENRDLVRQMFEKTGTDLGLENDEMEKYWKERRVAEPRTASYGGGSFIVTKKVKAPRDAAQSPRITKPMTDEEWWGAAGAMERAAWLTASFVESSGMFEVVRVDAADCAQCGGRGAATDGAEACTACQGCGVVRSVTYR